jgi:transposase
MEKWCEIRQRVLRDGVSIRQIQRETGFHFDTVKKILAHSSPPEFQTPDRPKTKIGPYQERIGDILDSDRELPRKQRHTVKKIFERLQEEGYSGSYSSVKVAVRELKETRGEVFMPLVHTPGEAQVDFGFALVKMGGELIKIAFFAMALPYSDAMFIAAYPRECTETFQDGHVRAFIFFGGVATRIRYDNAKTSVTNITGVRGRKLTDGFLQLQSHYLFEERFCRVRRPNEKGVVEGIIKFARLNYFVPVPSRKLCS